MKLKYILPFLTLFLISCAKTESNKTITLGDVLDLSKLEKATMHNNSGSFELNTIQLQQLQSELSQMTYESEFTVKLGAIYIELIIDGKKCGITSKTHADYIEVHKKDLSNTKGLPTDRDWLFFKTNGVNFDNYKPANK
jgi:hypothetical protein